MIYLRDGCVSFHDESGDAILELEDVSFKYPKKSGGLSVLGKKEITGLKSANLKLGRGIYMIIGPNGAGKTTLLSVIAGLIKPDRGIIRIEGKMMNERERQKHTSILIGTRPYFVSNMRVGELIKLIEKLFDRDLTDLIGVFEINSLMDRYVHTLSRGQLARLTFLTWLAKDSLILLGDEIDIGADSNLIGSLSDVLIKLSEEKVVILTAPSSNSLFREIEKRLDEEK